jgi:hypothetical protein
MKLTRCNACGSPMRPRKPCPSCTMYNAAVSASMTAARSLARVFDWRSENAWLNEHGVFAWVSDKAVQVAGPEVSAPFVALFEEVRGVKFPSGSCWAEARRREGEGGR